MSEQAGRQQRALAALAGAGVDALVVTEPLNVRYLSGFGGSNGIVVLSDRRVVLVTDSRYGEAVRALPDIEAEVLERDILGGLLRRLADLAPACERVGFEVSAPFKTVERMRSEGPSGIDLVPVEGVVERLRRTKSATEIAATRHASDILEDVYGRLAAERFVGRTEQEVAWLAERWIREAGFPALSFTPIVAAGANGALPHEIGRAHV